MPYEIYKKGAEYCVRKKDGDKKIIGCHKSADQAKKQMAAIYANEKKSARKNG